MRTLFRAHAILIVGLIAAYIIGCGDVDTKPEAKDAEAVDVTITPDEDKASGATNGKPVTVTDATFDTVVLAAELPVVLELGAEW